MNDVNRCDVCGARLLKYENPDRELCPRKNKHYLYVTGGTLGSARGGKKKKK